MRMPRLVLLSALLVLQASTGATASARRSAAPEGAQLLVGSFPTSVHVQKGTLIARNWRGERPVRWREPIKWPRSKSVSIGSSIELRVRHPAPPIAMNVGNVPGMTLAARVFSLGSGGQLVARFDCEVSTPNNCRVLPGADGWTLMLPWTPQEAGTYGLILYGSWSDVTDPNRPWTNDIAWAFRVRTAK